jgi:hypothetical protein
MKVALAVVLALLVGYFADQEFNGGRNSDHVVAMLKDIKHGFGY